MITQEWQQFLIELYHFQYIHLIKLEQDQIHYEYLSKQYQYQEEHQPILKIKILIYN